MLRTTEYSCQPLPQTRQRVVRVADALAVVDAPLESESARQARHERA